MGFRKGNLLILIASLFMTYGLIGNLYMDGVKMVNLPFAEIVFLIGFVPLVVLGIKLFIWKDKNYE